jgi:energy-coupling factor transport system ATP-binding protein
MESETDIIVLEGVSFTQRGAAKPLFDGISLRITEGEWVSIIGANGSGKSTFVRMLNGLVSHQSGRIIIDGTELTVETTEQIRQTIGIVFQNPDNQFVALTVADDIAFSMENHCINRSTMMERLIRYAELLGISELLDKHPGELSGGQKQRAVIAAVLAVEPKIIVFDEASSMLDEQSKHALLNLLRDMRESGKYTIITITHDFDEMIASDRIIAISDGSIIGDGPPNPLLMQDQLLQACRLKTPFILELCRELRRQGVPVTETLAENELLEELWAFNMKM